MFKIIISVLNSIYKFGNFLYTIMVKKKSKSKFRCICQKKDIQENKTIQIFEKLRNSCPALRTILIPNSHWDEFKLKVLEEPNEAFHNYIVWIAFERGNLNKLTGPIHDLLLNNNGTPKRDLKNNYFNPESWMHKNNMLERHKKVKSYCGILYELLIAEFLKSKNWTDIYLQALGAEHDIIAHSPDKIKCFFEIKYIGQRDEDFQECVKSIKGKNSGGWKGYYLTSDYLLFIVYTAAKQFEKNSYTNAIVIIVISNMHWAFVDLAIKEKWINWKLPKFYDKDRDFIKKGLDKYPYIFNELESIVNSLAELWIIKENNDFEFSLQEKVIFKKCT